VSLSERLRDMGSQYVAAQLTHPTVVGIAEGNLDPAVFRQWLEQDYLFLLDYVRVFSRLAWQAPDEHVGDLVDLAHATWHDELDLHRGLAAEFGADLAGATKSATCTAYTGFLLAAAASYSTGLAAVLPCMWGYSEIGQRLAADPPAEPRYAKWIEMYADPAFAALADRCARMLDESAPDETVAERVFLSAFDQELAFWDVGAD
jgi:thiaminase/transcriptional activator TenA